MFGEEVSRQLDSFENPEKYPKDFLNECAYFLGKLIGRDAANEKMRYLYKKYLKGEN